MRCYVNVMLYVINWYIYDMIYCDMICGRPARVMLCDFYDLRYGMICAWRELVRANIW